MKNTKGVIFFKTTHIMSESFVFNEEWAMQELKEAGVFKEDFVIPKGEEASFTHFLIKQAVTALKALPEQKEDDDDEYLFLESRLHNTTQEFRDGKRLRDEEEEPIVDKCLRLMDQYDAVRKEIMELK